MVTTGPTSPKVRIFLGSALKEKDFMGYRRVTLGMKTKSKSRAKTPQRKRRVTYAPRTAVKLIKRVVKSQAETKMVTFFGGSTSSFGNAAPEGQTIGVPDGNFSQAANISQNQYIASNATDILQILPPVSLGTADHQRVGQSITPVQVRLHCKVMISPTSTGSTGWNNGVGYDLTAVAYCLQHVSYKTYYSLARNNKFQQLLEVGDGTTINFDGSYQAACFSVAKGYYRVLARTKKIYLRSSGNFQGPLTTAITNNNSHPLRHEWVWDITKAVPKKLVYPEDDETTPGIVDNPLNAAPFWCVGYYFTDGTLAFPAAPQIKIQQEYVATMRFKDM